MQSALEVPDRLRSPAKIGDSKAERATREAFAREIVLYAPKYVRSEGARRERLHRDSDTLDRLCKVYVAGRPASRKLTSRPVASSHKVNHGARIPPPSVSGLTGQSAWTASCAAPRR